jgi:hypothetical protein
MEKASQHKAHTCRGMGCLGARLCFGGLCSGQAAGVLGLNLQPEFFSRHEVVGHGQRVGGGLFIERHARLLIFLEMPAAAPKVADNTASAATEPGVDLRRALDDGERVELVELGMQQRRLDAMNIARQHAHYFCFSVGAG